MTATSGAWLQVAGHRYLPTKPDPEAVRAGLRGYADPGLMHMGVSSNPEFFRLFGRACEEERAAYCDSSEPPHGTLEEAFWQEIAHHDFEIGGKNEWDGTPPRHSMHLLRQLSHAHTMDQFPKYAAPELEALRARRGRPLLAMDIGCGPISILRYGALRGMLRIVGVDPLLDPYRIVLARHGLDVLECIHCHESESVRAEDLDMTSHADRYDVIYTNNALDHTQDPGAVTAMMARALRPDGVAIIQVATNEGTRQGWNQLHKFDIRYEEPRVIAVNERGVATELCAKNTPLRLRRVAWSRDDSLAFLAGREA
jgi:SAM-dependent methyltransferase